MGFKKGKIVITCLLVLLAFSSVTSASRKGGRRRRNLEVLSITLQKLENTCPELAKEVLSQMDVAKLKKSLDMECAKTNGLKNIGTSTDPKQVCSTAKTIFQKCVKLV